MIRGFLSDDRADNTPIIECRLTPEMERVAWSITDIVDTIVSEQVVSVIDLPPYEVVKPPLTITPDTKDTAPPTPPDTPNAKHVHTPKTPPTYNAQTITITKLK